MARLAGSLALLLFSFTSMSRAAAQDCRDGTGEPVPCVASYAPDAPVVTAPTPPVVTAPADPPAYVEAPPSSGTAYLGYEALFDVLRPAGLGFTQAGPDRAPSLAREALVLGTPEVVVAGFSLVFGARPLPWLRIPEFRLSFGAGGFDESAGAWEGNGTSGGGVTFETLYMLRAEVAGGFEIPIDDFAIFALGHVALAGYFLDARLDHAVAGDLGVQTLAEDAWEVGWTVGVAWQLEDHLRMGASYRHVHTGAEADSVRLSLELTDL